jgi:hypothetical protein
VAKCRRIQTRPERKTSAPFEIVHAISPEAKAFYLALGFEASPLEPMTLMATLADIQATARLA